VEHGIREVVTFNLGMVLGVLRDLQFLTISLSAAVEAADELMKEADDKDSLYETKKMFDELHSTVLMAQALVKDAADVLGEAIGYPNRGSGLAV
jgi:hypothetical protein